MFILLFCLSFSTLLFYVYGAFFASIFDSKNTKYSFFDLFFIGFCLIGSILNYWSLFLPTNILSIGFLTFIAGILYFKKKSFFNLNLKLLFRKIKENKWLSLLILLLILIELLYSVGLPKNYDSYLYHINAIQWNEKFSVVPGLSNFHDRFGFNSSQFVLSAAFSFNDIYNQYLFIINSLCFLIFMIWIVLSSFQNKNVFSLITLLFGYYFFNQFHSDISSPSTDLLPNLLFGFLLLKLMSGYSALTNKYLLFVSVSFFIVTLKISLLPIVLIGLFAIYLNTKKVVPSVKHLFIFGSIFILPWLIRNVIISGYLIYPLDSVDIFNFEWEAPKEQLVDIKKWIYSWARIPLQEHTEVLSLSFVEWFSVWWKNCLVLNKIIFIISMLSPIFVTLYYFTNKTQNKQNVLIIFLVSYATFLMWLFSAPDIRFSFAALLILCSFPIIFLNKYLLKFEKSIKFSVIIMGVFFFVSFAVTGYNTFINEFRSFAKTEKYLYLPKDVYYIKLNRQIEYNARNYKTPNGDFIQLFEPKINRKQCFDKFPCSWYLNDSFELRGESIDKGFNSIIKDDL